MARSWWDKLWGIPEKVNAQQAKYTGPKPYTSLTEFPVGKSVNDVILSGLTGANWGYPAGYIERATSPFIEQLRVNAPKTQREIQDIYSARGLGRGTAAARDVGEVAAQRERDINQILANAYMGDIQQRKIDEANAIARGLTFSGMEEGTRRGAGAFGLEQMGAENQANLQNQALRRQYAQDETSALNRMIYAPLAIGSSFVTGNPAFALSAFGGGGTSGGFDWKSLIEEGEKYLKAKAFTKEPVSYDSAYYKEWPKTLR
jgi:hypothetical protein